MAIRVLPPPTCVGYSYIVDEETSGYEQSARESNSAYTFITNIEGATLILAMSFAT